MHKLDSPLKQGGDLKMKDEKVASLVRDTREKLQTLTQELRQSDEDINTKVGSFELDMLINSSNDDLRIENNYNNNMKDINSSPFSYIQQNHRKHKLSDKSDDDGGGVNSIPSTKNAFIQKLSLNGNHVNVHNQIDIGDECTERNHIGTDHIDGVVSMDLMLQSVDLNGKFNLICPSVF